MKTNIIGYVKEYGKYTFREKPLCDVDFLVFSEFSYIKLDGILQAYGKENKYFTLQQVKEYGNPDVMYSFERYREPNEELFLAMLASKRYKDLPIYMYQSVLDQELETQFGALTFQIDEDCYVIVFRGTDEQFVGWKEDFKLAFLPAVPAQVIAGNYLKHIADHFAGSLYLTGHSKGGNLSVFAAMNAKQAVRDRIQKIYSMDGPGFRPEILERLDYQGIKEKVCKLIPQSSIVGMLMENQEDYKIISSSGISAGQHNPFTWKVVDGEFVSVEELMPGSKYMDHKINEWINGLSMQELEDFTDITFQLVDSCEASTTDDLTKEWFNVASQMMNTYKNLSPEVKEELKLILQSLFQFRNEAEKNRKIHVQFSEFMDSAEAKVFFENTGEKIKGFMNASGEKIKEAANTTGDFVKEAANTTGDFIKHASNTTGDFIKQAANTTSEKIKELGQQKK